MQAPAQQVTQDGPTYANVDQRVGIVNQGDDDIQKMRSSLYELESKKKIKKKIEKEYNVNDPDAEAEM